MLGSVRGSHHRTRIHVYISVEFRSANGDIYDRNAIIYRWWRIIAERGVWADEHTKHDTRRRQQQHRRPKGR
jgi:hypothetical protein